MPTLTVTAKGQITLRQDLLKHLGAAPGQQVEVHKLPDCTLTIGSHVQDGDVNDFIACLHKPDAPVVSIDDMNEVIAQV
ncbi:MAG: AbrB/MazE/SpoVT family DNA-binding domain-containing protein [Proteobacteria bacterium]|nr:AbrB/MazE/SpoVT family DNA-binding domain-containing protein [Pseudomonadota bacterium]